MESLADGVGDSEDPRQLAQALRGFGRESGLALGPKMEAMLERLERGEDIETLETEMETSEDDELEDYFRLRKGLAGRGAARQRPQVDDELYFF